MLATLSYTANLIAVVLLVSMAATASLQCQLDTVSLAQASDASPSHRHASPTHSIPHADCLVAILPGLMLGIPVLLQRFCATVLVSASTAHPYPVFRPPPGASAVSLII